MDKVLKLENGQYDLIETVSYPNGGASYFYVRDQQAIIIDDGICNYKKDEKPFSYSLITDKQNTYMNKYAKVYRFLKEDMGIINEVITLSCKKEEIPIKYVANREDHADASPLEIDFENNFASVYGRNSLKYLQKEYGILDEQGNNYFLDYLLRTKHGDYAVEENGVTYHHPQQIGLERYRRQLQKQLGISFAEMVELAKTSTYTRIFDVNAARFSAPQDMRAEIHTALAETGEAPAMDADLINSVYHSLAYCYGEAFRELESLTEQHWDKLYIAGGGAKNATLNELTAHYTGKQVVALPIEATAIGNLKIQMQI